MTAATSPPPSAKSILRSKTFWLQIIAVASSFYPPVGVWVAANPVGALSALGGLNILVRFVTKGQITIFPGDEPDVGNSGGLGGLPLRLLLLVLTAAGLLGLPSCATSTAKDGTVTRRPDVESISLAQGLAAWAVGVWQYQEAADAAAEERKEERRAAKAVVIPSK